MTAALVAFAVSLACGWVLSRPFAAGWIADHPGHRSLHDAPIPRTGGLAVLCGLGASALVLYAQGGLAGTSAPWLVLGALLIAAVSALDDARGVSVRVRAGFHFAAGVGLLVAGIRIERIELPGWSMMLPGAAAAVVTVLFVVWTINLYNFMDGMDGFAGGMSVIGFTTLGVLAHDAPVLSRALFCVAAATAGFLPFNYPPARIFLGDTGSTNLGFIAGAAVVGVSYRASIPLWIAGLAFAPFFIDATITLLRRVLRAERFWEAHHSHYYQRLVRSGWSHRRAVWVEYGLMLMGSATAIAAVGAPVQTQRVLFVGIALVHVAFFAWIDRRAGYP